jgi:hypothetical protein
LLVGSSDQFRICVWRHVQKFVKAGHEAPARLMRKPEESISDREEEHNWMTHNCGWTGKADWFALPSFGLAPWLP